MASGNESSGSKADKSGFEEARFMKELVHLRDTQDAIQTLSGWCIRNRKYAYKIARCWLKCVKKVKTEHKLTLFHLLNDVVQHSKRRNYDELLDKLRAVLKESMPHLKEAKICEKVHRCLNIWIERQVFEENFINDLIAIIDPGQGKADQDILDNFQPQQLCTQIKILKALEDDTDYKLKTVKEADINLMEIDEASLRQNLKDRQHGNDYINDVEEGRKRLEQYIKAIDREITKRRQVIELLSHGGKYYNSLCGEANIVAQAYNNFGKGVANLGKKLHERISEFEGTGVKAKRSGACVPRDFSPIPSPDYDAPSPEEDFEPELPDDGDKKEKDASNGDLNSRLDSMRSSLSQGISGTKHLSNSLTCDKQSGSSKADGQDFSISEFLTKLATGESTSTSKPTSNQSSGRLTTSAHGYYDNPPTDAGWWLKQQNNTSNSQDMSQPPPISDWTPDGDPPPVTEWPAPRPDTWVESTSVPASSGDHEWQEPVPEWQIQPEDDVPPSDCGYYDVIEPSVERGNAVAYTESVALARLQQKRNLNEKKEDEDQCKNLIDLTSGNTTVEGSSHPSKIVSLEEDMEMCSDDDIDSFAHEQLELNDAFGSRPRPRPSNNDNGFKELASKTPECNSYRPSIDNKPTYGYIPPKKSQQEVEEEEREHQKTVSLQDRLRSLAGVPVTNNDATQMSGFRSDQPPPSLLSRDTPQPAFRSGKHLPTSGGRMQSTPTRGGFQGAPPAPRFSPHGGHARGHGPPPRGGGSHRGRGGWNRGKGHRGGHW